MELLQRLRGAKKRFSLHARLVLITTAVLILAGTAMIYFLEYDNTLQNLSPAGKIMASVFQAVSPRTAGFNTLDLGALHTATQFFIVILMFIGASPGSTGGGIKTTTFALLLVYLGSTIRGKRDFDVFNRRLSQELINKAVTILLLCSALVVLVSLLLSATEEADFLSVLFESTSAFATVGLTMGITTGLSTAGKIILILTMYLGRLGPLTVAFAMAGQKRKTLLRYPEEKISVG
ncbi:MAG: Ktr system potassium uptake protein B [Firmicutes bacterium ADurb.Bin456]|nr:MAG: Ktr system potassium uptake protein B [Firmicutes bacterium ADurb.Bin456]